MKTTIFRNLLGLFPLLAQPAFAQQQQAAGKTESTFTVKGNCGMCKKTIETAARKAGARDAAWNADTRQLKLQYNTEKASAEEILRAVAYAGYDNEKYLAPDEAYGRLPGCCRYEREETKRSANGPHHNHPAAESHSPAAQEPAQAGDIAPAYGRYFALQQALVQGDAGRAAREASGFREALVAAKVSGKLADEQDALAGFAANIAGSNDIEEQRKHFAGMYKPLLALMKELSPGYEVHTAFCPMYNDGKGAGWLTREKQIRNPFYGSKMLSCGRITGTVK